MDLSRDFYDLLAAFGEAGVRYLLVGGHAVAAHSKPRYTKDIDVVWIDPDAENLQRVARALDPFGAPPPSARPVGLRTCSTSTRCWLIAATPVEPAPVAAPTPSGRGAP
jgi:hypothetical protein